MSGETLLWMKIASRQCRSVPEAMEANPSSHVMLWAAYFEHERQEVEVAHYYLANIAAEIRRGHVKQPRQVKLEHFILKFQAKTAAAEGGKPKDSKSVWMAALGLTREGDAMPGMPRIKHELPPKIAARRRTRMMRPAPQRKPLPRASDPAERRRPR